MLNVLGSVITAKDLRLEHHYKITYVYV